MQLVVQEPLLCAMRLKDPLSKDSPSWSLLGVIFAPFSKIIIKRKSCTFSIHNLHMYGHTCRTFPTFQIPICKHVHAYTYTTHSKHMPYTHTIFMNTCMSIHTHHVTYTTQNTQHTCVRAYHSYSLTHTPHSLTQALLGEARTETLLKRKYEYGLRGPWQSLPLPRAQPMAHKSSSWLMFLEAAWRVSLTFQRSLSTGSLCDQGHTQAASAKRMCCPHTTAKRLS